MKSNGTSENIKSVKASGHEKEMHLPLTEKLKSIPEAFGIRVNEEPPYEVIKSDGDFEIRQYQTQVLAEVTIQGSDFDAFREQAFKKLAAYIFGENKTTEHLAEKTFSEPTISENEKHSETMAMTSPVLQQEGLEHEWTMSFVLPKKYNLQSAPRPLNDEVKLREIPGYTAAVVRYSGLNTQEKVKEHESKLMSWVPARPELQLNGTFFAAQYDAPFVIPFLRRNEVMVKVTPIQ